MVFSLRWQLIFENLLKTYFFDKIVNFSSFHYMQAIILFLFRFVCFFPIKYKKPIVQFLLKTNKILVQIDKLQVFVFFFFFKYSNISQEKYIYIFLYSMRILVGTLTMTKQTFIQQKLPEKGKQVTYRLENLKMCKITFFHSRTEVNSIEF